MSGVQKRRVRHASACVCLVVAGAVVGAARPQYGGTLRIDMQAIVRTLDPVVAVNDAAASAARNRLRPLVFETLVAVDPAGGLQPLLARSWEREAGGTRWRFRLRSGVVLHDGHVLEPWQVATALRASGNAWAVSTDGDVVVIDLPHPQPALPWELADDRHAVVVRPSPTELLGTGPFRIERLDASHLSLRAHDGYWSGRSFVDGVRVEMGRSVATQLADLELGRADLVEVQPADARRLTQRGLQLGTSRPLDLFVLVFEARLATPSRAAIRHVLATALDRTTMCAVLLQGRAEPAEALLPAWISGYAPAFVAPGAERPSRSAAAAVLPEQRALALRVDPSDALARSIAERIAVDAREAGVTVTVQAPTGLAPVPDLRLVRVKLAATSPDRALTRAMAVLGPRGVALATSAPPLEADAALDAVMRLERALLETSVVVPVLRVPELYGLGERVESWDGHAVSPTGAWNLASLWIRTPAPDARVRP
jgi:MarR-like DNA-binding transcriptional regulator SgrR of sgrS sRNA